MKFNFACKADYDPPKIEFVDVEVEQGFSLSSTSEWDKLLDEPVRWEQDFDEFE